MKAFSVIAKILAVLAAAVGAICLLATYGEKIVAWCKKTMDSLIEIEEVEEDEDELEIDEDDEDVEVEVEVFEEVADVEPVEEVVAEVVEAVAEVEAAVEEVVADDADFEG